MVRITQCCLSPRFKLRTQMMLSFGLTASIALGCFISIGLYTAQDAGTEVLSRARGVVNDLVKRSLSSTAQYAAQSISKKFNNIGGAGSLLMEVTRDRFVGYPNVQGWEDDLYVPFQDMVTGRNIYPIDAEYLPLDWQLVGNVDQSNAAEHIPNRSMAWYANQIVDTTNAVFNMQGTCDPNETNETSPTYFPNCTDQNNNVREGGKLKPTPTAWHIYNKAKDLSWVLKALYEAHSDVKTVGIFFSNSGAGANIQYPATNLNSQDNYTSIGCDWMLTRHPRSNKLIGTPWEIQNCHPARSVVSMREYNPMERGWCRDQVERDMAVAQNRLPESELNYIATGPYLDSQSQVPLWVMTFGQAVFDRATDAFLACTLVDVSVTEFYEILVSSKIGLTGASALARWDDFGTVIAASEWNPDVETEIATLTSSDLGMGITPKMYQDMRSLVDFSKPWNHSYAKNKFEDELFQTKDGERIFMIYPIPDIPETYDPDYSPLYMIVVSLSRDGAYGLLTEMEEIIDYDVTETWKHIGMVGGVGFGVIMLVVAYIASTLTKPLRWMQNVSGVIVNNAGSDNLKKGLEDVLDSKDAYPWCAPRTEVTKLVKEFEGLIQQFNVEGAAEVAGMSLNEVKNTFEWRRMYEDIYPWETEEVTNEKVPGTNIPRQLSISKTGPIEVFDDELTEATSTNASLFSVLSASITASVVSAQYHPTIQKYLVRTTSMVDSVKSSVMEAGIKAGVLKAPKPEKLDGPPFVNRGPNIEQKAEEEEDFFEGVHVSDNSFLFWWTTLLVGVPILVCAVLISLRVADDTTYNLSAWLDEIRNKSLTLEAETIVTAVDARSLFGEEVLSRFVRDLHIFSRLAGWVLFGGINRANTFTAVYTGAEECKAYSKNWQEENKTRCPFFMDPANAPCDCAWNDPVANHKASWDFSYGMNPDECLVYDEFNASFLIRPFAMYNMTDTRYLQRRYFEGQSDDTDMYGTRFVSSFPAVANRPNETNWWSNVTEMPGAYKGASASGFNTTYDRVRVTSALAAVEIPLYNYNPGLDEQKNLGTYVGFEHDGMMTGYIGCGPNQPINYPTWQSTESNGGPEARPLACPAGKYGYDARCRGWFADGKKRRGVYVTPPYQFAGSDVYGGSATFALEDPITGEHVGQTLMDFLPDAFMRALRPENTPIGEGNNGFPIVITPEKNAQGADVLVGPGYVLGGPPASLEQVALPYDDPGSPNRVNFTEKVADRMRAGEVGSAIYTRTNKDGGEEDIFITFAPLQQRTLVPINSSDFTAGVRSELILVYSLGFGIQTDQGRYDPVARQVNNDVREVQYVSLALTAAALLCVLYSTRTMSLYLSQPIMILTAIVKSIRQKTLGDDLPQLDGGSCEIYDMYESLEQLCKIVRFSTTAIQKGDRSKSYRIMEDALDLFVQNGNQKALGIANNNLGTMVLQEQMEKSSVTVRSNEVYHNGVKYFDEAIRIGTFEYQNAEFDDDRGDFVKQLANRYFNRGMFYIVNRKHPMAPPHQEQMGMSDIERAKSLDQEAYMVWRERGQLVDMASSEFGCLLRRARGMLTLISDGEFEDIWGIDELIDKANDMIHNPAFTESSLFEGVSSVARKQQVNDLRIQYHMVKGEKYEAAKIAIKMLVEDEYIVDTVIMNCVITLNKYYDLEGDPEQVPNLAHGVKRETRRGAVDSLRQAKNVIFCLDYSGSMAGERMQRAQANLLWVYEDHCLDKDHVGFLRFNHAVDEKLYFDLGRKNTHQDMQRHVLMEASDAEGGTRLYAALNKAVTMALNSGNQFDTWIIALTDGESAWDFPAKQVISRIEKNNKKGGAQIHVVIIGFEVPPEVADSVSIITRITEKSMYIDAQGGLDEMDNAFETVASVIAGTAITMETF